MNIRIRPDISALPAYKAGKPAPVGPGGASWKLSSNENPFAPLPGVLQKVGESLELMNRYPDMASIALVEALSKELQTDPERIALGAGSVSVIGHLLGAVCSPGDEVVYAWRSFEAYPISVLSHGATPVQVPLGPGWTHDLAAMRAAVTERTRAVMVCTPNNPTGPVVSHNDLEAFIDDLPDNVLIMVDEAYAEFITDPAAANGMALADKYPNVVALRTFSKAYGLAGMRVGYCKAAPEVAAAARALNPPFSVSSPAQVAAIASLQVKSELLARVAEIVNQRATMIDSLRASGFDVPDSGGNFVWLPAGERTTEWTDRFAAEGIMVRGYVAGDEFDGLRITVGEPEANSLALQVAANLPR